MGIYDRAYYRDRQPPGGVSAGLGGLRMLSVNTWLIILCVAVFAIDGFLPPQLVATGRVSESLAQVPREMWTYGDTVWQAPQQLPGGQVRLMLVRSVVERSTGKEIPDAWAEVMSMKFLESYLHFSTRLGFLEIQYWRFIGFQFLHANLSHLLFNMLGLYFFGPLVEQYLGGKRYLAFYLLCGIAGAIMYLVLNLGGHVATLLSSEPIVIPGLLFNDPSTPLIGASAGIFGVLMAGAYLAPTALVYLFFILPMRLRTLAYVLLGVALLTLIRGGHNAGGEAGHLGGAIAGAYFIRRPHHLHGFFDLLGRVDPTSHHYRAGKRGRQAPQRGPFWKPGGGAAAVNEAEELARRGEIDRILAKISAQGLQSLDDAERRVLRDASRDAR